MPLFLKATAVSLDGTKKESYGEKLFWKATNWKTK